MLKAKKGKQMSIGLSKENTFNNTPRIIDRRYIAQQSKKNNTSSLHFAVVLVPIMFITFPIPCHNSPE